MKITFIGGGNMATALVTGLVSNSVNMAAHYTIAIVEPIAEQRQKLQALFSATSPSVKVLCQPDIDAASASADVIVLAVKPQQMSVACEALAKHKPTGILLSIAAGTRISSIQSWAGGAAPNALKVVRAMPNTPATLGLGITGLVASDNTTQADKDAAQTIMRAAGEVLWVDSEAMIDAVTAVSGSGPGYVFYLMEAMQAGAVAQGFTAAQAKLLTEHTFAGASQLALRSGTEFGTLREQVTSKGGTTFAGLEALKKENVAQALIGAIAAAKARAEELGKSA
jgi:pyrroline-5-carboxylate reductase